MASKAPASGPLTRREGHCRGQNFSSEEGSQASGSVKRPRAAHGARPPAFRVDLLTPHSLSWFGNVMAGGERACTAARTGRTPGLTGE